MIEITRTNGSVLLKMKEQSLEVFPSGKSSANIKLLGNPTEEPEEGAISWPGEYDMGGVAIRGIGHDEGKRVSYAIEIEGVRLAFLSSPLHDWPDYELELLGNIDVLVVPADDGKLVQKLVDEIDPRVLIPLPGKDEGVFKEVLKAAGAQDAETVSDYKLKGSLPAEGREVVVLKGK